MSSAGFPGDFDPKSYPINLKAMTKDLRDQRKESFFGERPFHFVDGPIKELQVFRVIILAICTWIHVIEIGVSECYLFARIGANPSLLIPDISKDFPVL